MKAIHFTNTQVYEYFPDWFRSGSMNSPITQVSIKLDRFIPFKVLQLVCMQKKLILMHTFAWLKQQYHDLNNTHQLPLFWEIKDNMLIKPANRAKRTWFTKVARVIYVTTPMVWLCPAGIKQKSPIQKKRLCLFITMKKKVNRKTNKIRQVIDDQKKI